MDVLSQPRSPQKIVQTMIVSLVAVLLLFVSHKARSNFLSNHFYVGADAGLALNDRRTGIVDTINYFYNIRPMFSSQINAAKHRQMLYLSGASSLVKGHQGGLAGRINMGWNFFPYLGVEAGLSHFTNHYSSSATVHLMPVNAAGTLISTSLDLMAKVSLPLGFIHRDLKNIKLFAKAGTAYLLNTASGSVTFHRNTPREVTANFAPFQQSRSWHPAYSLGMHYQASKHLGVAASWMRIQGNTSMPKLNPQMEPEDVVKTMKSFIVSNNLLSMGLVWSF